MKSTGGNRPRRKGDGYENEIVKQAQESGLEAHRILRVGGETGLHNDVIIEDSTYECKRTAKPISSKLESALLLCIERGGVGVITRADNGRSRIYLDLADYLEGQIL